MFEWLLIFKFCIVLLYTYSILLLGNIWSRYFIFTSDDGTMEWHLPYLLYSDYYIKLLCYVDVQSKKQHFYVLDKAISSKLCHILIAYKTAHHIHFTTQLLFSFLFLSSSLGLFVESTSRVLWTRYKSCRFIDAPSFQWEIIVESDVCIWWD